MPPIPLLDSLASALPVASGGTGRTSTGTQYGVVYSSSATAEGTTAAGTTGQVLTATTGGAPSWASPSSSPTGAAGGSLTGTYPNPTIAALAVTDAMVAAANKDGAVGTYSMRTLGTGATQAAAGDDSRLSDARTPSNDANLVHIAGTEVITGAKYLRMTAGSGTPAVTVDASTNRSIGLTVGTGKVGVQLMNTGTSHYGIASDGSSLFLGPASLSQIPDTWGTATVTITAGGAITAAGLFTASASAVVTGSLTVSTTLGVTGLINAGGATSQSSPAISARKLGNSFEFGHTNTSGYGSAIGAESGNGYPFVAFCAEAGTTGNTYRTRGVVGTVIRGDTAGGLWIATVATANADNQTATNLLTLSNAGAMTLVGGLTATTGTFSGAVSASQFTGNATGLTGSPNITTGTITSGTINGQTISSAANFTNTVTAPYLFVTSGNPISFRNIGSGTYNQSIIYHDTTNGLFFDVARTTDAGGGTPLPFQISTRGNSAATFSFLPTTGALSITGTASITGTVATGALTVTGTATATTFSGAGTSLTGTAASLSIGGNAATATTAVNLSTVRTTWNTNGTITAVVGQLGWKIYGNNHTIFDASQSTDPLGNAHNNTNPDVSWAATYPTLMGFNGTNTYGVRVDSARLADLASGLTGSPAITTGAITATTVSATQFTGSYVGSGAGLTGIGTAFTSWAVSCPDGTRNASDKLPTTSPNAVRFDFSSSASAGTGGTYAGVMTFAPWTGTTASTGDASYQLAFGSTATNGGGIPFFNIRKGIDSTWNSWYTILHTGNIVVTNNASVASASGITTITNSLTPTFTSATIPTLSGAIATGAITATGAISATTTITAATFTGAGTGLTGTAASLNIGGNAATLTNFVTAGSGAPIAADAVTYNGVNYVSSNIALFGQVDGALYSQAYSSSWIHELFGDYRTGQLGIRGKNSGAWSSWRTVLDSTNYTSYAPTLTGTGASGSWGISITGTAALASGLTGSPNITTGTITSGLINGQTISSAANFTGTVAITGALTAASLVLTTDLAVAEGGTGGHATPTAGGIAYGDGTALAYLAAALSLSSPQFLQSNAGSAPNWNSISSSLLTDSLNVLRSGTTLPSNGSIPYVSGGGTNSLSFTAAGSTNQVLVSQGASAPVWKPNFPQIQAGSSVVTLNSVGNQAISYGVTFSPAPTVLLMNGDSANGPTEVFSIFGTPGTAAFNVHSSAGVAATRRINWIAIGYIP